MRKSIRSILSHLFNFRHIDSSCYRDKVSRAAGRRAVGSVFCSPFSKLTVTSKLRSVYRDSYIRQLYRDGTTSHRLPVPIAIGMAKNSPTLTLTAPNQTVEQLALIVNTETGSPRAVVRKFNLDRVNTANIPGSPLARLTNGLRAVIYQVLSLE